MPPNYGDRIGHSQLLFESTRVFKKGPSHDRSYCRPSYLSRQTSRYEMNVKLACTDSAIAQQQNEDAWLLGALRYLHAVGDIVVIKGDNSHFIAPTGELMRQESKESIKKAQLISADPTVSFSMKGKEIAAHSLNKTGSKESIRSSGIRSSKDMGGLSSSAEIEKEKENAEVRRKGWVCARPAETAKILANFVSPETVLCQLPHLASGKVAILNSVQVGKLLLVKETHMKYVNKRERENRKKKCTNDRKKF